jgi:Asp-tRNA(Asn)/Glu-tRNA(Gln) amidotransferase A subunit family amidase
MIEPRSYLAQASRLAAGELTPPVFLDACLQAIDLRDGQIGAFLQIATEGARRTAEASAERWRRGAPRSPIDGMPIAIKDIIETIDMPTGQGSPLWDGTVTRRDSAAVRALREAGAIVLGKVTTAEFAASHLFARTTNPHDPSRTPGGSSSGSAAAVGAGMVPAALGTQVVGSILRPASYCGCIGFKPSVGAINRSGSYDYFSQSCQGVLAATLSDAWAVLRAIADRAGGDPGYVGLSGDADLSRTEAPARLAVLETGGWSATSEDARQAFAATRDRLASAGVELRTRADDPAVELLEQRIADARDLSLRILAWEGRWPLNTYADLDASKLGPSSRQRLADGERMTQADYRAALAKRSGARDAFTEVAARYDAAVTLATTGAAPVSLTSTGDPSMAVPSSLLGAPALSLPVLADEGLPLGLQLIGARDADAALFEVAAGLLRSIVGRAELVGLPAS